MKFLSCLFQVNNCRRVLLILDMHVIAQGSEVGEKIGFPTQLTDTDTNDSATGSSTSRITSSNTSFRPTTNGTANGSSDTLNVTHTHPISSLSPYHNK